MFTVFNLYVYMCIQLYNAKGTGDVALNNKIKFICLFVCLFVCVLFVRLSLCCLITLGLSTDIRCHV